MTKTKPPIVTWRDVPAWLAVIIAICGIFLTYMEVRSSNKREIVFRAWDASHELYESAVNYAGDSSISRVAYEMRLLQEIHSHVGLLDDESIRNAAFLVSRAWSSDHIKKVDERDNLTCRTNELIELMADFLGTYRSDLEFPDGTFSCDDKGQK